MLLRSYACCRWPVLDAGLQVEDACVGKSVQVDWNASILLALLQINFLFSVIWLVDHRHIHPFLRHDDCESSICLLVKAKEVIELLVSILEPFCRKLTIANLEDGMIKLKLVD